MSTASQELVNKLDACTQVYNEKTKEMHFIPAGSTSPIAIMGPAGPGKTSAFTEVPSLISRIEYKNEAEALEGIIRICDARIHYNQSLLTICNDRQISLTDKVTFAFSCLGYQDQSFTLIEQNNALTVFIDGIQNDEKRYRNIKEIIITRADHDFLVDHVFDLIQVGYTSEETQFKNTQRKLQRSNQSVAPYVENHKANSSYEMNHLGDMLNILKRFTKQSCEGFSRFAIETMSQKTWNSNDFSNFIADFKRKVDADLKCVTLLSYKLNGNQCDVQVDIITKIIWQAEKELSLAHQMLKKAIGIRPTEELGTIFVLNMRSIYGKLNDACINLKSLKKDIERKIFIESEQAAQERMRILPKVESSNQIDQDVKQITEAVNLNTSSETAAAMPSPSIGQLVETAASAAGSAISATAAGNAENKGHVLKLENRKKLQKIVQKYAVKDLKTATENSQTLQVELKQLLVLYHNLNSNQKMVLSNLLQKKSKNNSNAVSLSEFINLIEGSKNLNGSGYLGGLQGQVIHKGGSHYTVRIPNTYQKWEKSKESILGYVEMPTASDGNFVPHGGSHTTKDLPDASRYLCCRALERAGITLERLKLAGIKMDINVPFAKK